MRRLFIFAAYAVLALLIFGCSPAQEATVIHDADVAVKAGDMGLKAAEAAGVTDVGGVPLSTIEAGAKVGVNFLESADAAAKAKADASKRPR